MAFSYDVSKLSDKGVDQMRFELGDTFVDGGQHTCALCDEEYAAVIACSKNWRQAKYACLCAIVSKLAYQVDYTASGVSLSLHQRYEDFKKMKASMEKGHQAPAASFIHSIGGGADDRHYFRLGLHDNPGHNRGDH